MARPVVGAHFRREEEDARASRTFSTAVATKDKDSTLPADMQGLPGGGLTSGATILLASGVIMNQEMYVVNDETMLAAGWLGLMYLFVKGGASGVAEALDERAAAIEADLAAQRQEEVEAVDLMISKAQDSIAVNEELIKVCAPENFDEWTTFKMDKTLADVAANLPALLDTRLGRKGAWPLPRALALGRIARRCIDPVAQMRCLVAEVLPELDALAGREAVVRAARGEEYDPMTGKLRKCQKTA